MSSSTEGNKLTFTEKESLLMWSIIKNLNASTTADWETIAAECGYAKAKSARDGWYGYVRKREGPASMVIHMGPAAKKDSNAPTPTATPTKRKASSKVKEEVAEKNGGDEVEKNGEEADETAVPAKRARRTKKKDVQQEETETPVKNEEN